MSVLLEAHGLITGDRAEQHGDAHVTFASTAMAFNAIKGDGVLTARDVILVLECLKMVRREVNPANRDNHVDLAGYTGLSAALAGF